MSTFTLDTLLTVIVAYILIILMHLYLSFIIKWKSIGGETVRKLIHKRNYVATVLISLLFNTILPQMLLPLLRLQYHAHHCSASQDDSSPSSPPLTLLGRLLGMIRSSPIVRFTDGSFF